MTQIKTEPEMEPMNRLLRIKTISDEAHSLKTERNPGKSRSREMNFRKIFKIDFF